MASINEEVAALPRYRHPLANVRGVPLKLPRTGLTVIPIVDRPHSDNPRKGWWGCEVVSTQGADPETAKSYPVGGYDICVGYDEIATAIEMPSRDDYYS